MRYIYSQKKLGAIFHFLCKAENTNTEGLSRIFGVNPRTVRSWRAGQTSVPRNFIDAIIKRHPQFILPIFDKAFDLNNVRALAAVNGGHARIKLHGNPGTVRGRKKGGIVSSQLRECFYPKPAPLLEVSTHLAECMGIILGDGGMTKYQVTVTLNKEDDREYSKYVTGLFKEVFRVPISCMERNNEKINNIRMSRKELIRQLIDFGLQTGNKVKNQAPPPKFIYQDIEFRKYFIRGLFDTDGCFYTDKHTYKSKTYRNGAINFTNRSLPLLDCFYAVLCELGIRAIRPTAYSVCVKNKAGVLRYFETVGSSNEKHLRKFRKLYTM